MIDYIQLLGGLIVLVVSGDYLVKGAVSVAKKLRLSTLVIGMTVIAFGTSAPELLVSLQAALLGNPDIAIGNVVGSNIANIGLILGITALIYPLNVSKNSLKMDWPAMMIISILFTIAASSGTITRWEGIIGFSLLVLFTIFQIYYSRRNNLEKKEEEDVNQKSIPLFWSIVYIIVSCFGLSYGAKFLIQGASNIAISFGISQRIVGITIVAFGTSLPELAASIAAAVKKEADIAIGNIIGSNIFNILSVIGLTSIIHPISLSWNEFHTDFIWMCIISFLLFLFILPLLITLRNWQNKKGHFWDQLTQKGRLGRGGAVCFLLMYGLYIYYTIHRL